MANSDAENTKTLTHHEQGQRCQGLSQHAPLQTSGLNFTSMKLSQILHWLRSHTHSQRLNFGWFCVIGCGSDRWLRSNRLAVLQSKGGLWEKLSSVSASDSLCPLHYPLINTASAQCSRQTQGLRSAHTRRAWFLGLGTVENVLAEGGRRALSLFQIPTSLAGQKGAGVALLVKLGSPGHAAAPLSKRSATPGPAASQRSCPRKASQLGWPVD